MLPLDLIRVINACSFAKQSDMRKATGQRQVAWRGWREGRKPPAPPQAGEERSPRRRAGGGINHRCLHTAHRNHTLARSFPSWHTPSSARAAPGSWAWPPAACTQQHLAPSEGWGGAPFVKIAFNWQRACSIMQNNLTEKWQKRKL